MRRWESFHTRAVRALTQLAITKQYVTSDDLHEVVGDPETPNQMGPVFDAARTMGLLRDTGRMFHSRRGPAKGRKVTLWESMYHRADPPDPDPVKAYLRQENIVDQDQMTLEV